MEKETNIIEQLLSKPFSTHEFNKKLDIITTGRPKPELKNLTSIKKCKQGKQDYMRHFLLSNYEKIEWLTGCSKLNKLFCWPCLLFGMEKNVWNKSGFSDLNHFSTSSKRHEKSNEHIQNLLKLKMFGKQRIDLLIDTHKTFNINEHNKKVTKNREILKRFIDVVCFLSKQELAFRGHDESSESVNKGNYIETLDLIRQYDQLLDSHLETSTVFSGTSALIQNDLIECVASIIETQIKNEIHDAEFVSIMLDETSDIQCKSQLSTVIRYVKEEKVYERFIGFTDVSADRSASGLFKHFEKIVETYNIAEKIVGQTYDGASVMAGDINGLKTRVLEKYPRAIFTHCYAHVLNLVLQQSLSGIKECRLFFQTLTGLSAFFSKSSKRVNALQEFIQRKLPSIAPTRWNFTSRLTNTVSHYRTALIDFFENIIELPEIWNSETIVQSQGFISFLRNADTVFLLEVCSNIFTFTDTLYDILQSKTYDILYCNNKIEETTKFLIHERNHDFDNVWKKSFELKEIEITRRKNRNKEYYKRLYNEIYDYIYNQLNDRFASFKNLYYFELLRPEEYSNHKNKFPEKCFKKLQEMYRDLFDFIKLRSELTVLYRSADFENKPIHVLLPFLYNNDLTMGFSEIFKLVKLILTIPYSTAQVERSFSTLKRIKSFNRSTQEQDRLSHLALISIEKELFIKIKNIPSFYDQVIDKFISKTRRIELIYK